MTRGKPTVFIVDDDPAMRDALRFMFTDTGLEVETFESGEAFLAALGPEDGGCLILDLRMPGMDGGELHQRLRAAGSHLPVIILTGHGDVPLAVRAMKWGAFDFLGKPVHREVLLERVREALAEDEARLSRRKETAGIRELLARLSPRELEVLEEVAAGHANKNIARRLGLSERTVANHRAHFMHKMKAANAADLVRKLALVGHIVENS